MSRSLLMGCVDMNPLATKLSNFMDITPSEGAEIESWCARVKRLAPHDTLIREGGRADATCIMLSGWASRHKDTRAGKRQIVGLLLPGDMCDLHSFLLRSADHSITMLSEAVVALVSGDIIRASVEREPRLMLALWWSTLVDAGIAREWLVNLGQRDAATRVANLICELWVRARQAGVATKGVLPLPLTQTELGEALGLTSVHINRTLKGLREQKLLVLRGKQAIIEDVDALMKFADFNSTYLQLDRRF